MIRAMEHQKLKIKKSKEKINWFLIFPNFTNEKPRR